MEHEFSHPLRRWRKANGVRQVELAKIVKVGQSHLSDIEQGNSMPSLRLAVLLSKATKGAVRVEEFLIQK